MYILLLARKYPNKTNIIRTFVPTPKNCLTPELDIFPFYIGRFSQNTTSTKYHNHLDSSTIQNLYVYKIFDNFIQITIEIIYSPLVSKKMVDEGLILMHYFSIGKLVQLFK